MTTSDNEVDMLMTATDVCERLRISRPTLHRWVRSGALPAPLYVGPAPRWRESDITDLISKAAESRDGGHT